MKTTIKTFIIRISFMLILVNLFGCKQAANSWETVGTFFKSLGDHTTRRNILFLLDVSSSTTPEQQRAFNSIIAETYNNLTPADRMVVSTIDGGSFTNPFPVVREDLLNANSWEDLWYKGAQNDLNPEQKQQLSPPFNRSEESVRADGEGSTKARLTHYKNFALPKLQAELAAVYEKRRHFAGATSILWALQNLQTDLEDPDSQRFTDKNVNVHNYIVVLSDMVEETREVNFNKPLGILRSDAEILLKRLNENNQIPSLHGSHIICIGRAKTNVITSEQGVQSVAEFWNAYFGSNYANGKLVAYDAIDKSNNATNLLNDWENK